MDSKIHPLSFSPSLSSSFSKFPPLLHSPKLQMARTKRSTSAIVEAKAGRKEQRKTLSVRKIPRIVKLKRNGTVSARILGLHTEFKKADWKEVQRLCVPIRGLNFVSVCLEI